MRFLVSAHVSCDRSGFSKFAEEYKKNVIAGETERKPDIPRNETLRCSLLL